MILPCLPLTQTIAHTFFNSADGFNNILATYACFACGFIARPIGGIFFGYLGDRYGRKKSLITSIGLMVIPSVLLRLLPGYHILGYISIVGVLFSRFLQGVSNEGEYITNAIYLTELAKTRKQVPLLSSFTFIGGVSGVGLGLVFAYTLRVYLGEQAFNDYGWRIPFLTSTLLAAYTMYLPK